MSELVLKAFNMTEPNISGIEELSRDLGLSKSQFINLCITLTAVTMGELCGRHECSTFDAMDRMSGLDDLGLF